MPGVPHIEKAKSPLPVFVYSRIPVFFLSSTSCYPVEKDPVNPVEKLGFKQKFIEIIPPQFASYL